VKRPLVLTILAILAIIGGVISLIGALLDLVGGGVAASGALAGYGVAATSATYFAYSAIASAVLGILYLAFGIGTFMSKSWAWTAGVVGLGLGAVNSVITLVLSGFGAGAIVGAIIALIIYAILLWYLFRPNVRAAYGLAAA
jgi:hypothetical protein